MPHGSPPKEVAARRGMHKKMQIRAPWLIAVLLKSSVDVDATDQGPRANGRPYT
jgi:hypothetical protein